MPVSSSQTCDHRLARAAHIPHTCTQFDNHAATLPVWRSALQFEFGSLTPGQHQSLASIYGQWHHPRNIAPYDSQRHYRLMDFMPPLMQALNRHHFIAEQFPLPAALQQVLPQANPHPKALEVEINSNCWGTVYEILRTAQRPPQGLRHEPPMVFMTGMRPLWQALRQHSGPVTGPPQPGDLLLFYHRRQDNDYLDHVAIAIDENLFFEKAGTGPDTPYRLVDTQTLYQSWRPGIFKVAVRRPHKQQSWLSPQAAFGLSSQATRTRLPQVATLTLTENFTAVALPIYGTVDSLYFFQMQPIHLQEVERGRFRLNRANRSQGFGHAH